MKNWYKKAKIASWGEWIWLSCPGNKACLFCFDLWCLSDKRSSTEFEPYLRVRGVNEFSKTFRVFNGQIISNLIYILNSTRRRKVSLVNRWSKSWEKFIEKVKFTKRLKYLKILNISNWNFLPGGKFRESRSHFSAETNFNWQML